VTLEMCTLYKGVPHGIALIDYTDPKDKRLSFRGVGVFHHGQLHNTPFTYVDGDGYARSYSKMHNGRPADASYCTYFIPSGVTQHVDSLEAETDVSGW
jgi:hypothetical protein